MTYRVSFLSKSTLCILSLAGCLAGTQAQADELYVRVVDTGGGLCTITAAPGQDGSSPAYMIYDAGHWTGSDCINAVREIIPRGQAIDLFVVSHSDGDHLGQAAAILDRRKAKAFLRTGFKRDTASWKKWNAAVTRQAGEGARDLNLATAPVPPGTAFPLGAAAVTFVAGWPDWTMTSLSTSERRNAISIVMRLDYAGRSVLFTGDTIGKRLGDGDGACKDAEKVMVDRSAEIPLRADVMTAPHHGGNNGSSRCFIDAIQPTSVIFSAGSDDHKHPTSGAAGRYLAAGVRLENMFRTDRGDDEDGSSSGPKTEWDHGRRPGCTDGRGDDDVEIRIQSNGRVSVGYMGPDGPCR